MRYTRPNLDENAHRILLNPSEDFYLEEQFHEHNEDDHDRESINKNREVQVVTELNSYGHEEDGVWADHPINSSGFIEKKTRPLQLAFDPEASILNEV
ncbi:unnamed protein product [Protopolystoma xenopodis]|uniref:Uncharacterized protein n=1 Tax=Protopolystoma xenopodis TaxID=117903 RepID=A0A3S5CMF3_9PLAT|nr:unnamed protein product [Protopolystoma xenopodis]